MSRWKAHAPCWCPVFAWSCPGNAQSQCGRAEEQRWKWTSGSESLSKVTFRHLLKIKTTYSDKTLIGSHNFVSLLLIKPWHSNQYRILNRRIIWICFKFYSQWKCNTFDLGYKFANCPCGRFQCLYEISQYLSSFPDHDIVIVTIADAQDISSYTVASTGQRELLYCLIKFVPGDKKKEKWREGSKVWVGFVLDVEFSSLPYEIFTEEFLSPINDRPSLPLTV